mgnify:CR=1 FL=1
MYCGKQKLNIKVAHNTPTDIAAKVILLVLILRGINISFFSVVAFALALTYIIFSDNENGVCCMFFLLPFANVFKLNPTGSSFFTYLTIVLALKLIVKKQKIEKRFLILWMLLFAIQVVGCNLNLGTLIKQASVLLLVYGYFHCCKNITKQIVLNFGIGVLISCFVANMTSIFSNSHAYLRVVRAYEISLDTYRFTALYSDPNYLAKTLIVLCISLFVLIQQKAISPKYYVLIALLIGFGFQTISKSFFLMLIVMVILFFAISIRTRHWGVSLAITLFCAIVVVLFMYGRISVFDSFFERITSTNDVTTGRMEIWKDYISVIFSNPINLLFGFGIGSTPKYMAHNTYLELLYTYGIFGSLTFIAGLKYAFGNKIRRGEFANWAPAIADIIMVFFISSLVSFDFGFNLILILSFIAKDSNKQIEECSEKIYDNGGCSGL